MEIEEIHISKHQRIFIVEIHPLDLNVVYISKLTDYAYIRRGDETQRIPLIETLKLIEEKRIPRVRAIIKEINREKSGEDIKIKIRLSFRNEGAKPAYHSISSIYFSARKGNKEKIAIKSIRGRAYDITDINPHTLKAFQIDANHPLYPNLSTVFGEFEIEFKEENEIEVKININEEMTYSSQKFIISKDEIKEIQSLIGKTYI